MASRATLGPMNAEYPSSNFPQPTMLNRRPLLAYDAATDEEAYWTMPAPQGLTGTLSLVITYIMASATSGNVMLSARVEAVSDGDATDLDAGDSWDSANASSATAVPATAGYIDQVTITLTNADSAAAGDYMRVAISRDANHASDTAIGDLYLVVAELRDAA